MTGDMKAGKRIHSDMANRKKRVESNGSASGVHDGQLRGWKEIAEFLGQPVAVAQRWAKSGMPVVKKGRSMTAEPEELNRWLGRESGVDQAVHIARGKEDLMPELRRGVREARKRRAA